MLLRSESPPQQSFVSFLAILLVILVQRAPHGDKSDGDACKSIRSPSVVREGFESIREELRGVTEQFRLLSLYQRFEHIVILLLTALIVVIVIAAVWSPSLKILFRLVLSESLDPLDYSAFQALFGMIVIIALEFKKSLLVVAERRETFVQIRSVVLIALLAICRKVIILDFTKTDALHIVALAAAILVVSIVYSLTRDSDQRAADAALSVQNSGLTC